MKKCESASDKLHVALYNFTVTCISHISVDIRILFVHTVVHQSTVRSADCNKLQCQKEVVMTY